MPVFKTRTAIPRAMQGALYQKIPNMRRSVLYLNVSKILRRRKKQLHFMTLNLMNWVI